MSDPTTPEEVRAQLRRLGIPDENLSDEQALKLLGDMIRAQVPAPPIPAGTPPVNGRAWLAAALTAGGFAQPADCQQTADLGDDGDPVPLAALAMVVMRHLPNARPRSRGLMSVCRPRRSCRSTPSVAHRPSWIRSPTTSGVPTISALAGGSRPRWRRLPAARRSHLDLRDRHQADPSKLEVVDG